MKKNNVSIVIPIYNVEEYIECCLLSVINQTYNNIEIVLVNDCTPDNSMEIAVKILRRNNTKNVKIINHEKNSGLSAARNTGVKHSTGEFLFFIDSDDCLYSNNSIQELVKLCDKDDFDLIIGSFVYVGLPNARKVVDTVELQMSNQVDIFNAFLDYQLYEMAWNKLIKRDFFLKYNLWFSDGLLHEDNLWSFFVFYNCQKLLFTSQNTYKYYIRGNSIMGNQTSKNILSLYKIFCDETTFIEAQSLYKRFPLLIKYMVNQKLALLKRIIEFQLSNDYFILLQKELKLSMVFKYKMSILTVMKMLLSNMPFSLFSFLTIHFFNKFRINSR